MKSMFHDTKVALEVVKGAADNEDLTGAGVDMSGYEGVAFIATAEKGEIAEFKIHAEQDKVSTFAAAADLAQTEKAFSTAVATDAHVVLDIHKPLERYVRPVVTVPNLNAGKGVSVISIRYNGRFNPQTNVGEFHVSPAEGTV